jgi:hypothetical protein
MELLGNASVNVNREIILPLFLSSIGAERFVTRMADEALLFSRLDTDIALADVASGMTVPVGAEYRRGVHDAPPGCAWKHCHEKYVWTPVCFTTSPHHGLVWCYRKSSYLMFSCITLL